MGTIRERLEPLRGQDYYDQWWECWREIRDEAIEAAEFLKATTGGISTWDLVDLCDLYVTPFKPLVVSLETAGVIERGTYEMLRFQGFSVERTREQIAACRESQWRSAAKREGELTPIWDVLQKELALL